MILTRRSVIAAAVLLCHNAAGRHARAASFPTRPIRIVIPFSAGTTLDVMARALSEALEPLIGQLPSVVNRGGATGLIAMNELLAAEPDGHTWLLSGPGQFTIQPHIRPRSTIQPADFVPVCQLYDTPLVLLTSRQSGIASFEDLLKRARSDPGTITVAHYGPGSATHLMMEAVAGTSKVKFLGVSYRAQSQLLQDLTTGTVQAAILAPGSYAPELFEQILILAPDRIASIPNVPTIAEIGQPLPFVSFAGIYLTRTVPESILSMIEAICIKAAASALFENAARRAQVVLDIQPHDVFAKRVREQGQDMKVLIEQLGLKME